MAVSEESPAVRTRLQETYRKLPLSFEANQDQIGAPVRFRSRGPGYTLFLTPTEAVLALTAPESRTEERGGNHTARRESRKLQRDPAEVSKVAVVRVQLVGADRHPDIEGMEELPGRANYFIGKDAAKWRTGIPTYTKVKYHAVYPGVDLVYYGDQRQLEFDFIVAPGADPSAIRLNIAGADRLEIDAQGDLVLDLGSGQVRLPRPFVYQTERGMRHPVSGGYVLQGSHQVSLQVAAYDGRRPLVIDPTLAYSTYLGGASDDIGLGIAIDAVGNAYVTGFTGAASFPTTAGIFQPAPGGSTDAFVTKLNPSGAALLYSTYLGGAGVDDALEIAVDGAGNAYVTGNTSSPDFPTTAGAFQTDPGGAADAFVTKLDATDGTLVYSTYLGGSRQDAGRGIVVDAGGNAYVTGHTGSPNFPTTAAAFQTDFVGSGPLEDAFVTKLNPGGTGLVYATYLGGIGVDDGAGIAVDGAGNAYVAGGTSSPDFPTTAAAFQTALGGEEDAFVTKLDATGRALGYSTYLGGIDNENAAGIAVDVRGNAYVAGNTISDFPTTAGALQTVPGGSFDAFVTKLNLSGTALVYSTYLGGTRNENATSIAVNVPGEIYVTGTTSSADFPTTPGASQAAFAGRVDAFVTKLDLSGAELAYSTYLGGAGSEDGLGVAVDSAGNAYVTGHTSSADFPTTAGAFQTAFAGGFFGDAFVEKFSDAGPPATLSLTPLAATNLVGNPHCVTATAKDASANPTPGVTVRFSVTGSVTTGASVMTDASGEARICYTGPPRPGRDAIAAHADTDADDMQDPGDPSAAATRTWVLPPPAPR